MQDRAKADALAQVPEAERATAKWEFLNENPIHKMVKRDGPLTPSLAHVGDVWQLTLPQCVFPAWRADGAPSHVTTLLPEHPIAAGLPAKWDIPQTEMYDEPFHVPTPDAVVFEERWTKASTSVAAACGRWARVASSTSGQGTRLIPCIDRLSRSVCWKMPCAGLRHRAELCRAGQCRITDRSYRGCAMSKERKNPHRANVSEVL